MARSKNTEFQIVKFGMVAFDHNLINAIVRKERRKESASKLLRDSFAHGGWNAQLGIIGCFGSDSPIWNNNPAYAESLRKTYESRRSTFARLSSSTDEKDKVELTVFKELYCDDKGEVIKPRWLAATCNGRGEVYYDSQVLRATGMTRKATDYTEETAASDPLGEVPIQVKQFSSEAERVRFQVQENSKEIGFFEMTSLDKLRAIAFLFETTGLPYAQARREYPGTIGQKGWLLVKLNSMWNEFHTQLFPNETVRPNLNLVARCELKSTDPGYISFASLNDVSRLAELVAGSTPDGMAEKNRQIENANIRLMDEGKDAKDFISRTTAEAIERFVTGQEKSPTPKGKVLSKDNWEGLRGSKNHVIKAMAESHLGNNTEMLRPLHENKDTFNKLWSICADGKGVDALVAMECMKHPLFAQFAELALAGKTFSIVETPDPVADKSVQPDKVEPSIS